MLAPWRAVAGLACVLLLQVPALAVAALGEDEASVEADRIHLKAAVTVRQVPRYAVHEFVQPSGTSVREYVSPAGKVFAVGWDGPVVPDLRQVLGSYFERYVAAAKSKPTRRTPVAIDEPTLVVRTGGHMRAFTGRAYVPALVPQDVDVEALR